MIPELMRPRTPVFSPISGAGRPLRRAACRLCAACAVLALCLAATPGRGGAAESPEVAGIAIVQSGTFTAVPAQDAGLKNGRYRLLQAGENVPAQAGAAFGVVFEVQGKPAGAPVTLEAGLVRPGGDEASALRWFIPALVGEKAQAVATFVYAWEAVPGPWRLTLAEGGRVLAGKEFYVGERPAPPVAEPVQGAAPASPATNVAPVPPQDAPPPVAPMPTAPETAAPPPAAAPVPTAPDVAGPLPTAVEQALPTAVEQALPAPAVPAEAGKKAAPPEASGKNGASDTSGKSGKPEKPENPDKPDKPDKAAPGAPKKAQPPEKPTDKAPAAPEASGKGPVYLVQAGVFSVKDSAYAQAARYRAKGYPGCVLEEGGGKNVRYRVIVGRFPDQERAAQARRSFVGREGGEALVKEAPAADVARRLKCR